MNSKKALACLALGLITSGLRGQVTGTMNYAATDLTFFREDIPDTVRILVISDTHLFRSDRREDPYRQFSARMAGAYNSTRHFQTGQATSPERELEASMVLARDFRADAIVHLGDLLSFPSEAGVEYARDVLDGSGIPWYYIGGNHDWHYEGMEGSEEMLREEWSPRRLAPLMRGRDHLNYAVDVKGVRLILVNDGINEVLPSQVAFLRDQLRGKGPCLLLMHIPLYAPGRQDASYTIGNPHWGAAIDRYHAIERRPQWPTQGHGQADYDFLDTALKASRDQNLVGVIAGHVHVSGLTLLDTLPMVTVDDQASGGYLRVTFVPLRERE